MGPKTWKGLCRIKLVELNNIRKAIHDMIEQVEFS